MGSRACISTPLPSPSYFDPAARVHRHLHHDVITRSGYPGRHRPLHPPRQLAFRQHSDLQHKVSGRGSAALSLYCRTHNIHKRYIPTRHLYPHCTHALGVPLNFVNRMHTFYLSVCLAGACSVVAACCGAPRILEVGIYINIPRRPRLCKEMSLAMFPLQWA